ncbi:MAG: hypothetical protein AB3N14_18865 [Flavobacteriaceae bacterium]
MKRIYGIAVLLLLLTGCQEKKGEFVCKPCGLECDQLSFAEAGTCPHCNMPLVKQADLQQDRNLKINKVVLRKGSGSFRLDGGPFKPEKTIEVFYYKPDNFNAHSQILIVVPGAGRNGDSYRDAWIPEAENYNLLVLAPSYSEADYSFEDYHLGGILSELNLENNIKFLDNSNIVELEEEGLDFRINPDQASMIFPDFDRIFDEVVSTLKGSQKSYDIFGHSAGGQILHRMALFYPHSKAKHIIASNAGFYTLPDFETELPFGIKATQLTDESLKKTFSTSLILLIGELDNAEETGGTLLRSRTADIQGLHRLSRGKFFYDTASQKAAALKTPFNWRLEIVPQVGHDHEKMGDHAAKLLYKKIDEN